MPISGRNDHLINGFKSKIQMLSHKICIFWAQRKCSACFMNVKIIDFGIKNNSFCGALAPAI